MQGSGSGGHGSTVTRLPPTLRNTYFLLRHGRSMANDLGIIVSDPANGVLPEFGLSPEGVRQAQSAGVHLHQLLLSLAAQPQSVRVLASPFSRALETAHHAASQLAPALLDGSVQVTDTLRERHFGPSLELQPHDLYEQVWATDAQDPAQGPEGGESVLDVARRLGKLIADLEDSASGKHIILVSHGDALQIADALFVEAGLSPDPRWKGDEGGGGPLASVGTAVSSRKATHLAFHRTHAFSNGEIRQANSVPGLCLGST